MSIRKVARRCLGLLAVHGLVFVALSVAAVQGLRANDSTHAEERAPVELEAMVDRAVATTSDEITFSVRLSAHQDFIDIALPEFGDRIEGFAVVDFGTTPWQELDLRQGWLTTSRWYRLRADISGSYVLPGLEVNYLFDGKEHTAATSEIFVEITAPSSTSPVASASSDAAESTTPGEMPENRDIRGLKDIIPQPRSHAWLYLVLAVGALVLAGAGGWVLLSHRRKLRREQPLIPHEEALRALEELAQFAHLDEVAGAKEFHFKLSATLRLYFERQFLLPASDRTLEELRRDLPKVKGLDEALRGSFIHILAKTDLVKFAGVMLDAQQSLELLEMAEVFVRTSMPHQEPQEHVV